MFVLNSPPPLFRKPWVHVNSLEECVLTAFNFRFILEDIGWCVYKLVCLFFLCVYCHVSLTPFSVCIYVYVDIYVHTHVYIHIHTHLNRYLFLYYSVYIQKCLILFFFYFQPLIFCLLDPMDIVVVTSSLFLLVHFYLHTSPMFLLLRMLLTFPITCQTL